MNMNTEMVPSFSAPVVSGVAAMVLSHKPELTVRDLRENPSELCYKSG
jgi:hypothetical protein